MIDAYKLENKLGSGLTADVFKATHEQTGAKVALKVFQPKVQLGTSQILSNEIEVHRKLSHKNIITFIDASTTPSEIVTDDGEKHQVGYIASELAPHGDLFTCLTKGSLSAPLVRLYGKQLLEAVHHMHSQGIAHRDLKCENILIDGDFNCRVADFGFACPHEGDLNNGFCTRIVGTQNYMAPELIMKRPYQPAVADLFALGVILFMMHSGSAPFHQADYDDPYFRLLALNEHNTFWEAHSAEREPGFFSEEFKNLISQMLSLQPFQRLCLVEVMAHPYFTSSECATPGQARREIKPRLDAGSQDEE